MKTPDRESKHLWIIGLRRSGTTAVWRMFRDLENFTCFDEPFNPKLETGLPEQDWKKTRDEFIDLWHKDHDNFVGRFQKIEFDDELNQELTRPQISYLEYLRNERTVIDFTRVNFKLEDMIQNFGNTSFLLLFRSPIAFVSSHIISSEISWWKRNVIKPFFFTNFLSFNRWGIQDSLKNKNFFNLLDYCDIKPKRKFDRLSSVEKLLCYWLCARRYGEITSGKFKNEPVYISSYEDIMKNECGEFNKALSSAGINPNELTRAHLIPVNPGYRSKGGIWRKLAHNAGFSNDEFDSYIR